MWLLRILVLNGLQNNRKLTALYVNTKDNYLSDALSCKQMERFFKRGPEMNKIVDQISSIIWPIDKVWQL